MDIVVAPLDVTDDAAVERAYEIVAASEAADLPDLPPHCRTQFVGALRHPMPGSLPHFALARVDGVPAGYLSIDLPQLENTDNAEIDLHVHPRHRRQGVGRALHEYAVRLLREQGRKWLTSATVTTLPGGPQRPEAPAAFAAATGAKAALVDVRRRLDVTTVDQAELDRLLAAAWPRAEGYSLVRWIGDTPERDLDDIGYLDGRLIEDAPMGDLAWGPAQVDADRVRGIEKALNLRGRRRYHCAMRHDATGRIAAWTLLDFGASSPWHAYQQITIVEPRHRGHRLGTIIKIENLRYALANEPGLRVVDTWNAAVNDHMISINEAIGFRPVDSWTNWQLDL